MAKHKAITDTYEYDAFGNKINSTGSTPNNYLYRGEQYDTDLGLYYLRARYLNPATGRFLSRDPEDHSPTTPNDLHKYLYADGDPINYVDPSGHEAMVGTIQLYARISVSAAVITGLRAASAAVACAILWEGTKTYAEVAAGPFGSVTMIAPCIWFASKPQSNPWTGTPGSTSTTWTPAGTPKQSRRYGPDGYPDKDTDFDHDHGQGQPHVHDWGRPTDGGPPTHKDRGPGRRPQSGDPEP